MAEMVAKIEALLAAHRLSGEIISIRMGSCPYGCSRAYITDVRLIGRPPGQYELHLGGDLPSEGFDGRHRGKVGGDAVMARLKGLLEQFARERRPGESLGDFVIRTGRAQRAIGSRIDVESEGPGVAPRLVRS